VVTDGLLKDDSMSDEEDEILFEELQRFYYSNPIIVKEFAQYIND